MIYSMYRWTADRERLAEHEAALAKLGEHIKESHPLIRGVRCWKVVWGQEVARPGRVWVEMFSSWTEYEAHGLEHSAACDEAWAPVFASMVPGTMTSAAWEDAVPGAWFDR